MKRTYIIICIIIMLRADQLVKVDYYKSYKFFFIINVQIEADRTKHKS